MDHSQDDENDGGVVLRLLDHQSENMLSLMIIDFKIELETNKTSGLFFWLLALRLEFFMSHRLIHCSLYFYPKVRRPLPSFIATSLLRHNFLQPAIAMRTYYCLSYIHSILIFMSYILFITLPWPLFCTSFRGAVLWLCM